MEVHRNCCIATAASQLLHRNCCIATAASASQLLHVTLKGQLEVTDHSYTKTY
jgi:hypothetical protein